MPVLNTYGTSSMALTGEADTLIRIVTTDDQEILLKPDNIPTSSSWDYCLNIRLARYTNQIKREGKELLCNTSQPMDNGMASLEEVRVI